MSDKTLADKLLIHVKSFIVRIFYQKVNITLVFKVLLEVIQETN